MQTLALVIIVVEVGGLNIFNTLHGLLLTTMYECRETLHLAKSCCPYVAIHPHKFTLPTSLVNA